MITVKAFYEDKKGLYCQPGIRKFRYKVGKTYYCDTKRVRICMYGFHASANCDISETLSYYPISESIKYCLVDLRVLEKLGDKAVGDKITILKELSIDECIKYDKTGMWSVTFAASCDDINILNKILESIIQKDITGKLYYRFARDVKNSNVKELQDEVIKKDKTGEWCFLFACNIKKCDVKKLQDEVIKKDETGEWCYYFASNIKESDEKKLQKAVIEKDKTGKWCYRFAASVKNADIKKLETEVIKKDNTGQYCYYFAKDVKGANIIKLQNAVIEKDKEGKWRSLFAGSFKDVNVYKLRNF